MTQKADNSIHGTKTANERVPLKVAILGTRGYPSYYGGFETAVRKLAPYLAEQGWDVTVYGRGQNSVDETREDTDKRINVVHTLGFETKSLSTLTYGFTSAVNAIRSRQDVVLIMNVANGYWLPLFKLARIPTVVNVDGIEWDRAKWNRVAKAVFKVGAWFTAKFANEIIADSKEIVNRWKQLFKVDATYIPYGGERASITDRALPFEPGTYLLIVSRLVPENTINEIFEAIPAISATTPVIIVGSSGYGGDLEEKAKSLTKLENVEWLGHVSDDSYLANLWSNCSVYIHGHSVGGTNPALLQAMSYGARIIARDTTYNREVLEDTGIYFFPSAESIIETFQKATKCQQTTTEKQKVINRVETYFSWNMVCEDYEKSLVKQLERSKTI